MQAKEEQNRSSADLMPGSGLAPRRTPVICFCCVQGSADPPFWRLSEHPTALLTSFPTQQKCPLIQ